MPYNPKTAVIPKGIIVEKDGQTYTVPWSDWKKTTFRTKGGNFIEMVNPATGDTIAFGRGALGHWMHDFFKVVREIETGVEKSNVLTPDMIGKVKKVMDAYRMSEEMSKYKTEKPV